MDDLRVGSPYIDLPGITAPGQVFVIYGQASRPGIRVMPNRGLSTLGFDTAVLDGLEVRVADLPGGALGSAFGRTLTLDRDGAGHGWFLDPTPGADEEFLAGGEPLLAREGSEVRCRTDLLSVVLHELGHWLGRGHEGHGVMAEALDPGSRQLPESPPSGRPSSTTANGFARGVLFTVAPAEEALSALAVDVAQIHAKRRKRQGAG